MSDIAGIIKGLAGKVRADGVLPTLRSLKQLADGNAALAPFSGGIDTLMDDFDRMGSFFVKGIPDPGRGHVYETLYSATVRMARNMQMAALCTEKQAFIAARKRAAGMQVSDLSQALEQYVPSHTYVQSPSQQSSNPQDASADEQAKQNDAFCNRVFSVVLASGQWTVSDCESMGEAVCLPAVNDDLATLTVSAVTLSAMSVFDREKVAFLKKVYAGAHSEQVRQRALVGLVLLLAQANDMMEEDDLLYLQTLCASMLAASEDTLSELLSLQKQALRQLETPQLTDEVEKRLMPGIMDIVKEVKPIMQKGDNDESSLEEIIDSDLNDRIGEKIQEKVGLLLKYKSEGMDVDYHTFRKMSPCGFFHTLSHWFVPFSINHPELLPLRQMMGQHMAFFDMVCHNNGFCNVDAYNFLFSMYNTLGRSGLLSKSMKNMPLPEEMVVMQQGEQETPEMIRTSYLRDLYRFFTLSPMKDDFANPFTFGGDNASRVVMVFLGHPVFADKRFAELRLAAGRFCAKKKWYTYIPSLNLDDTFQDTEDGRLLIALYEMYGREDYAKAIRLLTPIAMLNPGKHAVVKLLAQCCRSAGKYDDALQWYRRLPKEQTDLPAVKYQMTRCLLLGEHEKEAVNGAYELDYLYPDNPRYMELLMLVLCQTGQYEKAQEMARKLSAWHKEHKDKPDAEEQVNVAVCHWLSGYEAEAYRLLYECASGDKQRVVDLLVAAKPILLRHDVSETDYRIMYDMICSITDNQ